MVNLPQSDQVRFLNTLACLVSLNCPLTCLEVLPFSSHTPPPSDSYAPLKTQLCHQVFQEGPPSAPPPPPPWVQNHIHALGRAGWTAGKEPSTPKEGGSIEPAPQHRPGAPQWLLGSKMHLHQHQPPQSHPSYSRGGRGSGQTMPKRRRRPLRAAGLSPRTQGTGGDIPSL